MSFKKGDVIIRQGWGSQSPLSNGLKLHQTTSMFHRRFVSWQFHGGWDVSFSFWMLLVDYSQGHENGIQGHYARGADDYNQIASFTTFCLAKHVT